MLSYSEIKEKVLACVPNVCPICGGTLTLSEDLMHLTCDNPECDGKISRKLEIAAKSLGIDNIGPGVAKEFVDHLNVTNIYQVFDFAESDFLKVPRFQDGMAQRLYSSIHAIDGKSIPFKNFIRACQFKRVGEGTADDLANAYKTVEGLLGASASNMVDLLGGMTEVTSGAICESIKANKANVLELAKRITIEFPKEIEKKKDLGITCVVTGPLGFGPRPEFQEVFGDSYGIKWGSSVTKKTDILVTNETTPTGKYKKAQELQASGGAIKIMTEQEFLTFIGAGDIVTERLNTTGSEVLELSMFDGSNAEL